MRPSESQVLFGGSWFPLVGHCFQQSGLGLGLAQTRARPGKLGSNLSVAALRVGPRLPVADTAPPSPRSGDAEVSLFSSSEAGSSPELRSPPPISFESERPLSLEAVAASSEAELTSPEAEATSSEGEAAGGDAAGSGEAEATSSEAELTSPEAEAASSEGEAAGGDAEGSGEAEATSSEAEAASSEGDRSGEGEGSREGEGDGDRAEEAGEALEGADMPGHTRDTSGLEPRRAREENHSMSKKGARAESFP